MAEELPGELKDVPQIQKGLGLLRMNGSHRGGIHHTLNGQRQEQRDRPSDPTPSQSETSIIPLTPSSPTLLDGTSFYLIELSTVFLRFHKPFDFLFLLGRRCLDDSFGCGLIDKTMELEIRD